MRPSSPQRELLRGDLFDDRYEVEELLGRGGMGSVYRVLDRSLGDRVALKTLTFDAAPSLDAIARFRQEVRLARRVTHPNVARVYDIGEHADMLYLTMELIVGETLRAVLRAEGKLPPLRAARIARALSEGLRAAHEAGVVHRDLKPPNVLIERTGRVVITDFGIARSFSEASDLTMGAIGTPHYMAPEQAEKGSVDPRTDLYALGLLLREMLTGERPRTRSDDPTTKRHGRDPEGPLASVALRCLAHDPADRPRSASEVTKMIDAAMPDAAIDEDKTVTATISEPVHAPSAPAPPEARTLVRSSAKSLFVGDRVLAVLPFRYRGPADQDYVGDGITDELIDVLSRTRGLVVLASGATQKFRAQRDPRAIGAEVSAYAIIDGSVQLAGSRVRITVRLVETSAGVQLWSDTHEGELCDIFRFQELIAKRVAEELRVELTARAQQGDAPSEAIELYMTARRSLRAFDYESARAAVASLTRTVELAPSFAPALAAHAVACLRCWFFGVGNLDKNWGKEAGESVRRALLRAPDLAETHLASGVGATHKGDYTSAVRSLRHALAIAPTYAEAHEYLGMLECEAGRANEGVPRLGLAKELDPMLTYGPVFIARYHALRGEWEACDAELDALEQRRGGTVIPLIVSQRVRNAAWKRDHDKLDRWARDDTGAQAPGRRMVRFYAEALLGSIDRAGIDKGFAEVLAGNENPRFHALAEQLATEVYASLGDLDTATSHLGNAAANALVDLDWMDRCPLLDPLRAHPAFAQARGAVRARAELIWVG